MSQGKGDHAFVDAVPEIYERLMVPMIFQPYAVDLAARVAELAPHRVLEIAAGTGALTRQLAIRLPDSTSIVATDLNQAMLRQATAIGTRRPVEWQAADALRLPFPDASFDAVVCQFGTMFFPDKHRGYSEIRRVLTAQGHFLFSTWDRIEDNDFAAVTEAALEKLFPGEPPRFLSRTPHGYHDVAIIERELRAARFRAPAKISTVTAQSPADSARVAATAYCLGTPLRNEIEARATSTLDAATEHVAEAIARRFGTGPVTGKIQAQVFSIAP